VSYTVHRSEKSSDNPYAQISRKMAQDSSLSFQARGLLLYILSKPPTWKGKASDLQREGNIKEKALKTMLDELIAKRYIVRHEGRNAKGRFEYRMEVFEEPELNSEGVAAEKCLTVPPSRGGGTVPPSRLPREGGSVIDSTCARADLSTDKRERKEREPAQDKPRRKSTRPPAEEVFELPPADFTITDTMRSHVHRERSDLSEDDFRRVTPIWRAHVNKAPRSGRFRLTLDGWRWDWIEWMLREKVTNGNGANGNGKQQSKFESTSERNVRYIRESLAIDLSGNGAGSNHQVPPLQLAPGSQPGRIKAVR
jgi:hypothetical protein